MKIQVVENDQGLRSCIALRRTVFINEQGVSEAEELDGEDIHCTHVIATDNGVPVGTARFRYVDGYAKIQRVCVPKEFRGKNYGAKIIQFVIDQIGVEGRTCQIRLGAQTHAIAFYEKLGFAPYGAEFLDANIPHVNMEMEL